MRKNTKILIAVLAVVIALMMVLPMITALFPQRGGVVSTDDVYYADEHEEHGEHDDEDPALTEAKELYRETLRDALLAIESEDKTGVEMSPVERVRSITDLEGSAGFDLERTAEAVDELMGLVEDRPTFIEKFDNLYKDYLGLEENHEIMEAVKSAVDNYRE